MTGSPSANSWLRRVLLPLSDPREVSLTASGGWLPCRLSGSGDAFCAARPNVLVLSASRAHAFRRRCGGSHFSLSPRTSALRSVFRASAGFSAGFSHWALSASSGN
jgi:hypothetical protein